MMKTASNDDPTTQSVEEHDPNFQLNQTNIQNMNFYDHPHQDEHYE